MQWRARRLLAAQYDAYGTPETLVVREVPPPSELAADDIRVRVEATSVNPKDTFVRKGRFRALTGDAFPKGVGYDWAGIVERIGPAVTTFAIGDRAFGMVNGWAARTCAQVIDVAAAESSRAPTEAPARAAAAIPLAAQTALQALRDVALARAGQRVFINGASGGVGLFAIQIARTLGAHVSAAASAANEDLCRDFGADAFADYANAPLEELGAPFDVILDVFGNLAFEAVANRLGPRGVLVTTVPNAATMSAIAATQAADGKRVRLVAVTSRARDLETLADAFDCGALRVHIDATYALENVRSAHAHVERKHTRGKVLVAIDA